MTTHTQPQTRPPTPAAKTTTATATPPPALSSDTEAFLGKVIGDLAGTMSTIQCALGDHLGLFGLLATTGPATSAELAAAADVNERYTREWASGLAAAGYLHYDPVAKTFALPAAHEPVLAQEGGPAFLGGFFQEMFAGLPILPRIADAFRHGGGVPVSEMPPGVLAGTERMTQPWFDHKLVQEWIPATPALEARLRAGCRLADIGCGSGRALVRLAQAFPKSSFVGYDYDGPSLERAREQAKRAGVADRIRFVQRDINKGLDGPFDIITAFDVIHDMGDPKGALNTVRKALAPGGTFLLLEINTQGGPDANQGPLGTIFYGASMMYCLTVSLAEGGHGLGTAGMTPDVVRAFCQDAGFRSIDRVPVEDPFNVLYTVQA